MWIIRFHLLETKDYNKISRICKKYGFSPRKISPVVFAKTSLLHLVKRASWRSLGSQYGVSHITLYQFYDAARKTELLKEILHVFISRRIALYIGNRKHINNDDLMNDEHLISLTSRELESMLGKL